MDIKDMRAEKEHLEREILDFIQGKVRGFEEKTGVYINDLRFEMTTKDYHFGKVRELTTVRAVIIL
jgi:hypothetical protein